jgi:hypothetical protein
VSIKITASAASEARYIPLPPDSGRERVYRARHFLAAVPDRVNPPGIGDVGRRIAIEHDQVGELAGGDGADAGIGAEGDAHAGIMERLEVLLVGRDGGPVPAPPPIALAVAAMFGERLFLE